MTLASIARMRPSHSRVMMSAFEPPSGLSWQNSPGAGASSTVEISRVGTSWKPMERRAFAICFS